MARIYDNIDIRFKDALQLILKTGGIERADFCVGYFNMRGWDMVDEYVENIKGGYVAEGEDVEESKFRCEKYMDKQGRIRYSNVKTL